MEKADSSIQVDSTSASSDFGARLTAIEARLDTIVKMLEKAQQPKHNEHSLLELAGAILLFLGLVALVVYGMVVLERYQQSRKEGKLPN